MNIVRYFFNGRWHQSPVPALALDFVILSILSAHPDLKEDDIKIGWQV